MVDSSQEDPGDPCNSYQWSIVFDFIMVLAILAWVMAIALILHSRHRLGSPLSATDRVACLLALCSFIQFGPMLASTLHSGHNIYSYTQTGCKLMFYTEYGTRHVVTSLVLCLVTWGYFSLHHGYDSVEGKVQRLGLGWVLLAMAAIQGVFGMVPAMYVDLGPYGHSCSWVASMRLTFTQVVSMEVILRPITPYLLPGILCLPIILILARNLPSLQEETRKTRLRTVIIIVSSYFLLNLPYAVNLLVEYGIKLSSRTHSFSTLCNFKWFFFLLHQSWFLLTPLLLIIQNPNLNLPAPSIVLTKFRKLYDDKARLITGNT